MYRLISYNYQLHEKEATAPRAIALIDKMIDKDLTESEMLTFLNEVTDDCIIEIFARKFGASLTLRLAKLLNP